MAETLGLRVGLLAASVHGYTRIQVEGDSKRSARVHPPSPFHPLGFYRRKEPLRFRLFPSYICIFVKFL
ncbi:hypothetical protein ACLB2K_007249 [Fragaria x ananassa]